MVRVVVVNKGCIHGPMNACDWPGRETWVEKSSLVYESYSKRAAQSKVVRMMVSDVGQKREERYPQTVQ
jgi:hypothetical protein